MQHRTILSLALILGLVPALNTAPLLAMPDAQEAEGCESVRTVTVGDETFEFKSDCTDTPPDYFSEGLQVAVVPEAGSDNQLYAVQFIGEGDASNPEQGAYIPERFNSEAMVVKVLAGNFAFRTQGPGVIVDTQDQDLEGLKASTPIPLGTNPDTGGGRTYDNADPYPCNLLVHEHKLCLLVPTDFTAEEKQNMFVRLDPGDTVFLPDNSTCFLCNSGRIDSDGNEVPTEGIPAELLIWSATTGFNGDLQNIATAMATPSASTATSQGSGRIVGWMFNPGSTCK
jgi:hypothetical protein